MTKHNKPGAAPLMVPSGLAQQATRTLGSGLPQYEVSNTSGTLRLPTTFAPSGFPWDEQFHILDLIARRFLGR